MQDTDDKRKKAIKKVVDKEEKARAPVLKRSAQTPSYFQDLQESVQQLIQRVDALNAKLA